jgi:hypothetical protein
MLVQHVIALGNARAPVGFVAWFGRSGYTGSMAQGAGLAIDAFADGIFCLGGGRCDSRCCAGVSAAGAVASGLPQAAKRALQTSSKPTYFFCIEKSLYQKLNCRKGNQRYFRIP